MHRSESKKRNSLGLIALVLCCIIAWDASAFLGPKLWKMIVLTTPGVLSNTFDTATPLGSDAPSTLDDHHRLTKAALQERLNDFNGNTDEGPIYWPLTGTQVSDTDAGQFRFAPLREMSDDPDQALTGYSSFADMGFFYTKAVAGVAEGHFQDESLNVVQMTSGGSFGAATTNLLANTLDVTGNIDPTSYETTNGGFLDEDAMGSNSATKVASQQSIVAYVANRHIPFCRAFLKTSAQTLGSGAWATIQFNNDSDSGLGWDASSIYNTGNYRITPGVEGYYQVNAGYTLANTGEGKGMGIRIYKNGTIEIATVAQGGRIDADVLPAITVSDIVYLDADDYIQIQAYQNSGSNKDISTGSNAAFVSFART